MDDRELIQRIVTKDHIAFKLLVDRYQVLVINACYGLLGNRQDAEDVAQEVFLNVYKSAESFRHQSKLSTWLYRIAINLSLNHLRKKKRFRWLRSIHSLKDNESAKSVNDLSASEDVRPDISFEKKERRKILWVAINALPENQRVAFVLHKYEGLSYQEIAEILECSLSAVESRIHRAKANLQKRLIHYLKEIR